MTILEIENSLNTLISNFNKETFIFDLLLAYGTPKSTIKRLQGSDHDKLALSGELIVRKKLFFKVANENLHSIIDELKTQKDVIKHINHLRKHKNFKNLSPIKAKIELESKFTYIKWKLLFVLCIIFYILLWGFEKWFYQVVNKSF